MHIETIKSQISDNYFYAVVTENDVALVDPVDANSAISFLNTSGKTLRMVLNTHWHPDHVSGNDEVLAAFGGVELVSGPDFQRINELVSHAVDRVVAHGDEIELADQKIQVIETPGHTLGHVAFLADRHLLSGDTIFGAGCGHVKFGGDIKSLFQTFDGLLSTLSADITYYPGHHYLQRNLEFGLHVLPENQATKEALNRELSLSRTLGEERKINIFMRTHESQVQEALKSAHDEVWANEAAQSSSDAETAFRVLRNLRNSW